MLRFSLMLFVMWLFVLPASAQVYRWVDEKGKTHYGERPPQGRKAQEVKDRLANPAGSAGDAAKGSSWQDQEREFQGRRIKAEEEDAKRQVQDASRRQTCVQARDQLAQMKTARRIYKLNEKGERVFHDEAEHSASIARQERAVAANCG